MPIETHDAGERPIVSERMTYVLNLLPAAYAVVSRVKSDVDQVLFQRNERGMVIIDPESGTELWSGPDAPGTSRPVRYVGCGYIPVE